MAKSPSEKPVTIRFTARAYERARAALLKDEKEAVCFLCAHVVENTKRRIFLVDHVVTLDDSCYLKRSRTSVVVDARCKNAVYSRCFVESSYTGFINLHSHPFEKAAVHFSQTDDDDDLREMAWQRTQLPRGKRALGQPTAIHALSMVFGQESLDARGFRPGLPPTLPAIEQVQVLGETLRVLTPTGVKDAPLLSAQALATYDRQIKAFGEEGQSALALLRIGLVGCGGVGSILAEDLARLGVTNLTLLDHDLLSTSNLNRWQGGRPKDVGRLKVRVLASRLRAMFPQMRVTPIALPLTHPKSLAAINGLDILIGAVDNHITRFVLNRLSVQYLIPYLDAATAITKGEGDNNNRMELLSRLGVVVPGTTACLNCSQITYYEHKDIAPHLYDPQTHNQLIASGYVQDHPEMEAASVMPLNMLSAGGLLIEFLNLVCGFHPLARNVAIDYLRPNRKTLRSDSDNFPEGPATDCLTCSALLGTGDSEPLPAVDMGPLSQSQIANHFPRASNE